jgi:hypothetical protein
MHSQKDAIEQKGGALTHSQKDAIEQKGGSDA